MSAYRSAGEREVPQPVTVALRSDVSWLAVTLVGTFGLLPPVVYLLLLWDACASDRGACASPSSSIRATPR